MSTILKALIQTACQQQRVNSKILGDRWVILVKSAELSGDSLLTKGTMHLIFWIYPRVTFKYFLMIRNI